MVLAAYSRSVARDNIRYFRFFLHMPKETDFISQRQNKLDGFGFRFRRRFYTCAKNISLLQKDIGRQYPTII